MTTSEELRVLPSVGEAAESVPELQELLRAMPAFDLCSPQKLREADYYGAAKLVAEAAGMPITPISRSTWMHGWGPFKQWTVAHDLDPAAIFGPKNTKQRHLFHTEEQAEFAIRGGWSDCHAVGSPFIYTRPSGLSRIPNSLLIMPPHVTAITEHFWDEDEYVEMFQALRGRFSLIVACVSAFCVAKNYWVKALDRAGIPWVVGASTHDRNGLCRMRALFDSFEFVTSNQVGSLHAYAAYAGCKCSVWGIDQEFTREQFKDDPMWQRYPEGLEVVLRESKRERSMERFPFFFCEPDEAEDRVEWSRDQLGEPFRREPSELAKLLGWRIASTTTEDDLRRFLHSMTGALAMKAYRIEGFLRKMIGKK